MDPIKDAFSKVKQDMDYLMFELGSLRQQITDLKEAITNNQTNQQFQEREIPTNQHTIQQQNFSQNIPINSNFQLPPTHINEEQTNQQTYPTQNLNEPSKQAQYSLKTPKTIFSTGNEGVPTNQQSNQPTNQRTGNEGVSSKIDSLERASEILKSLDELKREVRIKFKKLTEQEMLVFSTIYTFDELKQNPDYPLLAKHLKLTEISIRDYIRKIIAKGIPLEKTKENNKKIILSIPLELKRIASLQTILQLREI